MTSTTDMTQHPDVSEISDLTEGLLSPSRTADIQQHLNHCPLCTDVYDSLEEIRALLGTLPGPPQLPADIAGRIDAALAAEALLDASTTTERGHAHVSRETVSSPDVPAPRGSTAPEPGRAGRPAGSPSGITGPGRSTRTRRHRRRNIVLGTVLGTAVIGISMYVLPPFFSPSEETGADSASSALSAPAISSQEFSAAHLQRRVDDLLALNLKDKGPQDMKGGTAASGDKEVGPNTPLIEPNPTVPSCIQRATGRAESVIAFTLGTYEGIHAYLVLLPHSTDKTQVQAYVIDAGCVDSAAPSPQGKVLLTHSYPRH